MKHKLFFVIVLSAFLGVAQNRVPLKNSVLQKQLQSVDSLIDNKAYQKAEVLLKPIKAQNEAEQLQLEYRQAEILYGKGSSEQALNLLLKDFEKKETYPEITEIYANQLGRMFYAAKNYVKTVEYFKHALNYVSKINDTTGILRYNINIGLAFYKSKQLDSASIYYKKILKYPLNAKTGTYFSKAYNNLLAIALNKQDYKLASQYSEQAIKLNEQAKDTMGMAYNLVNLGTIYYTDSQLKKADSTYLKAYHLIQKDSTNRGQRLKRDVIYNLAFVNQDLKAYKKAINYFLAYKDLADKITQEDQAQNLSEVEAKYNVAQKEKDLEIQKAQNLNKTFILYGVIIFIIAMFIFGYAAYRNYRLKQQNKLDAVLSDVQTRILNATIDAKEQERKTIASILHDSVSALLSSANLHLQASKSMMSQPPPVEIKKAQDIVSEASVKIRDLSHELISSVLIKFGLAFAVHDLCQKYSNSKIYFHSQDKDVERYDQDFEIKMHSIIEELINNVLKHSKAENATVSLIQRADKKLLIQIIDDGVGFDVPKAKQKDGLGLSHIEARIKVLNGQFIINSIINEGTEISIIVPTVLPKTPMS